MTNKTRLKVGLIAFFTFVACAVAKHWLTGIDLEILAIGAIPTLAYIYAETKRPSV